jgi:phosphate:Na+ symporter
LFFIGVKLITSSFTQLTSMRLRNAVRQATGNRLMARVIGTAAGAITQSNNAVTFIVVGLVSGGAMQVRQGLPILAWCNVGTSILIFIATINTHDAELFLLGLVGLCYYFSLDKSAKYKHAVSALLGISLLFNGLGLIRMASADMRSLSGLQTFLEYSHDSLWLAFILGAALTPIVQTAKTASAVAVAMVSTGLLSLDQAVMIVLGSNFSSSFNVAFMSSNIEGTSRQMSLYQAALKIAGVGALLPIFLIDSFVPGRPMMELLGSIGSSVTIQVAIIYLLAQLAAIVVLAPFEERILRLLAYLSPPSAQETLSRPKFISDHALHDVVTASDLAEHEQMRQIKYLPLYLSNLREDDESDPKIPLSQLSEANKLVMRDVEVFLKALLAQNPSGPLLERIIALNNRSSLIISMQDSIRQFAAGLEAASSQGVNHRLIGHLVESLHLILSVLPSALAGDDDDREFLMTLTGDKTDLMENKRRTLGQGKDGLSAEIQDILFNSTTLFERIIWLVRRFAVLVESAREEVAVNKATGNALNHL